MGQTLAVHALDLYRAPDRLIAEGLRRTPLFAALPSEHRDCLALLREGAFFEVPAGVQVLSPGDPPALLVVAEGELSDRGRSWPEGSHLGVGEMLSGLPFAAAVRTAAPTRLYQLDAARLRTLLARCPAIARCLLDSDAETPAAGCGCQPTTERDL